jgi:hypothetical protein
LRGRPESKNQACSRNSIFGRPNSSFFRREFEAQANFVGYLLAKHHVVPQLGISSLISSCNQFRKHVSRSSKPDFRETFSIGGFFWAHVNGLGTAPRKRYEARCRLNNSRSAYRHKNCAIVQRFMNAVEVKGDFSKPADVRTYLTTAFTAGNFCRRFIRVCVIKRHSAARIATTFEQFTMYVNHVFRAGLLMKIVDV